MKHIFLLFGIAFLFAIGSVNAQSMRISVYNHEGVVMGSFADKNLSSNSAGYVDFNSGGGVEFNYYTKKNIGIGLRWSGNYYARDFETYETDLKAMLNITDELYDVTQSYGFWSFGSDLGVSYLADISDKFTLEPYFYLGFRVLTSPLSRVVYAQNGTTYHYEHKPSLFVGASYSPGIKMHWNVSKHVGLHVGLEYAGSTYMKDNERSLIYSSDTFQTTDAEKTYSINALNLGLGLSFRFGKALNE